MSTIFHIDENNRAVQLHEVKYESEDLLQHLVAQYPDILAGEQINPENPRKWILVSREMGVPGHEGGSDQWFLDHLFIDQDGIPTFVEVKRSTDTRIRREVVAQMLDYAANASLYWPVSRLREAFDANCDDPTVALHEQLGIALGEEDAYWEKVGSNLRLGKLRLLFVADEIPESLQRIIEFLNGQMTDTEVLGLEIKQYVSSSNQRTLVPKLVGKTISAIHVKKPEKFEWNQTTYIDRVIQKSGEEAAQVCERLLQDFEQMGCYIYWGQGSKQAGFVPIYTGKQKHQLLAVYCYETRTKIEIYFQHFKEPYNTLQKKMDLLEKFNTIEGLHLTESALGKRPSFDCRILCTDSNYTRFIEIYQEILSEIQRYER